MDPVERDSITQHARPDAALDRVCEESAAIRHQQDDAAARILARFELIDAREQRTADIGVGKASSRGASSDAGLNDFVVLRERHDVQRSRAEEHQRKSIVRAARHELRQQLARHGGLLRTATQMRQTIERIDAAPVTGQHLVIHAPAAIHEHQDFRAPPGALGLQVRAAGTRESRRLPRPMRVPHMRARASP